MKKVMKVSCELCNLPASTYCESDQAKLCWNCDSKVHKANFLVNKHPRNLLCHLCQNTTPWTASGAMLPPCLSLCVSCATPATSAAAAAALSSSSSAHHHHDDGCDSYDDDHHDDDEEEEDEEEEEEEGDEDNQVVPLTSSYSSAPVLSNDVVGSTNSPSNDDDDVDDGGARNPMLPSSLKHDLMVFCYGHYQSAYMLLQGLQHFSLVSGLQANKFKSELYQANMCDAEVAHLCQDFGFKKGTWPFKYLGAPICNKAVSAEDCEPLIHKMMARIHCWQSRHLSFAGRLQLVNAVLMSVCTYWMQIIVLRASVLKHINDICRRFLWEGKADSHSPSYVKWENVCKAKKYGRLGIRNIALWNALAVGKIVWQIEAKKDNLWVKWVHAVYIKDHVWWDYKPPITASWIWRDICRIKDQIKNWDSSAWSPDHQLSYKIGKAYKAMTHVEEQVPRHTVIWNRLSIPKHKFLWWLAVLGRLKVKDRLWRHGVLG